MLEITLALFISSFVAAVLGWGGIVGGAAIKLLAAVFLWLAILSAGFGAAQLLSAWRARWALRHSDHPFGGTWRHAEAKNRSRSIGQTFKA